MVWGTWLAKTLPLVIVESQIPQCWFFLIIQGLHTVWYIHWEQTRCWWIPYSHSDATRFSVDRSTQLVCIWIFICWAGGGNSCGVEDFCIGDSCRKKTDKNPKRSVFFQYYLIRSWAISSWTRNDMICHVSLISRETQKSKITIAEEIWLSAI